MRAVTFTRFGGPDVLEVAELPEPTPGPGEVRIRVAAATVNPTDIGFRAGRQASQQLAEMGVHPPYVPGMELAGVVDAAGPGTAWRPGERVMAIVTPRRPGGGAQAELVVVPSASVARVPAGTSLEAAAAALPMNGLTVRLALDRRGRRGRRLRRPARRARGPAGDRHRRAGGRSAGARLGGRGVHPPWRRRAPRRGPASAQTATEVRPRHLSQSPNEAPGSSGSRRTR